MSQKLYLFELGLVFWILLEPFISVSLKKYYYPVLFGLMSTSLIIEKARVYTPLILFIIAINSMKPNSFLFVLKYVLFAVLAIAIIKIKYYNIKTKYIVTDKLAQKVGKFVGYKSSKFQNIPISVFYPTSQKSNKRVRWLVGGQNYVKNSLEAMQVITHKKIYAPFWMVRFIYSYLTTYYLQVQADTKIQKQEKYDVVFISHGIAGTMHSHSSNAGWWANQGFIVVSLQHNEDGRVLGISKNTGDLESWKKYYEYRNQSLGTRVKQLKTIVDLVFKQKYLNSLFNQEINLSSYKLVGHSFGGSTVIQTASELSKSSIYNSLTSVITFDPWLFPLSEKSYSNLEKPILNIKAQNFMDNMDKHQPEGELLKKNKRFFESNQQNMIDLTFEGMGHLNQCDLIYVNGSLAQILKFSKGDYDLISEINALIVYLFQHKKTEKQIIVEVNQFLQKIGSKHSLSKTNHA